MTLTANVYPSRRDGKSYPVIEVDAIDLVTQFMDHCDVEQFVHDFIGHDRFLKVAVEAIKQSYSSPSSDPAIHKAKEELLSALGRSYVVGMAMAAASKVTEAEHYQRQYLDLYALVSYLENEFYGALQSPHLGQLIADYRKKNPLPRIGDETWNELQHKVSRSMQEELLKRVDAEMTAQRKLDIRTKQLEAYQRAMNKLDDITEYRQDHVTRDQLRQVMQSLSDDIQATTTEKAVCPACGEPGCSGLAFNSHGAVIDCPGKDEIE